MFVRGVWDLDFFLEMHDQLIIDQRNMEGGRVQHVTDIVSGKWNTRILVQIQNLMNI